MAFKDGLCCFALRSSFSCSSVCSLGKEECSNKERCICVWECCSSLYVVVFKVGNDNWMLLINCKGCVDVFIPLKRSLFGF